MKDPIVRVVILVAAVSIGSVRFWLRLRRRRAAGAAPGSGPDDSPASKARFGALGWLRRPGLLDSRNSSFLVASREIRERVRGRLFRVVTILLLAVVAAAIVIPVLTKSPSTPQDVGVLGAISPANRMSIATAAKATGVSVHVVNEPDATAARHALNSGQVSVVIVGSPLSGPPTIVGGLPVASKLLVENSISPGDNSDLAQYVSALATDLGIDAAVARAGLTRSQVSELSSARPVDVAGLHPSSSKKSFGKAAGGTSVIGEILMFVMLSQYCGWTLVGVLEEKSSRVVEVLLSTLKPLQLLAGKLLGIGTLALAQASLVVVFAVVLGKAVGSDFLSGTSPSALWTFLFWLILGYAFYSWLYAAAGSLAERQDQVQSLALPLSIPMLAGYILALTLAGSGNPSPFVEVLGYLPPTAPFIMPMMLAVHAASWWEFAVSAAICVLGTLGMARLAANIYSRAVLRTGRRLHLREVLSATV